MPAKPITTNTTDENCECCRSKKRLEGSPWCLECGRSFRKAMSVRHGINKAFPLRSPVDAGHLVRWLITVLPQRERLVDPLPVTGSKGRNGFCLQRTITVCSARCLGIAFSDASTKTSGASTNTSGASTKTSGARSI